MASTAFRGSGITPDTAWRFAAVTGTTPELWMNLQTQHDLAAKKPAELPERLLPGG